MHAPLVFPCTPSPHPSPPASPVGQEKRRAASSFRFSRAAPVPSYLEWAWQALIIPKKERGADPTRQLPTRE